MQQTMMRFLEFNQVNDTVCFFKLDFLLKHVKNHMSINLV